MPKKINPKSLANLSKEGHRPPGVGTVRTSITVLPATIERAIALGDGNKSRGIDALFAQLPVFSRVKLYLEQQAAAGDDTAAALLGDLDGLEIEQAREDAIAEGVIECPSGAYII